MENLLKIIKIMLCACVPLMISYWAFLIYSFITDIDFIWLGIYGLVTIALLIIINILISILKRKKSNGNKAEKESDKDGTCIGDIKHN